jgi:hypothetical protein
MTRYFIDTEFNEGDDQVELISIAIVSDSGRELYLVSSEIEPAKCNPWIQTNVLPSHILWHGVPESSRAGLICTKEEMKKRIEEFVSSYPRPEFWGFYADYDWYLLTRLWGTFLRLPKKFPRLCLDIKQTAIEMGVSRLPEPFSPQHNALADAKWTKHAYRYLKGFNNA